MKHPGYKFLVPLLIALPLADSDSRHHASAWVYFSID